VNAPAPAYNRTPLFFDWDDLLDFIEQGRVIPVIGPELMLLNIDGEQITLNNYLARELAASLGVQLRGLPHLNEVAMDFIAARPGMKDKLYSKLHRVLNDKGTVRCELLEKLAQIDGFKLFVSVTFDSLMTRAVEEAANARVSTRVFSLGKPPEDLPGAYENLRDVTVYHLFGKVSPLVEYVVTEEDTLEYLHVLQAEARRPKLLFDALRDNYLLVLGCNFSDWLMRFFLRTLKCTRLQDFGSHRTWEAVVDSVSSRDNHLALFLQQSRVDVFESGGVDDFVSELLARWKKRQETRRPVPRFGTKEIAASKPLVPASPAGEFVFISYAREDIAAAQNLKRQLEDAGVEVWLDNRSLEAGDEYASKIMENIQRCTLFIPILSQASVTRIVGFFRREWKWAIDRAMDFDERFPFIMPVIVDDTAEMESGIPEDFRRRHLGRFPRGQVTTEFVDNIRQLIRKMHAAKAGRL
jgi:hypothetical protein